MEAPTKYHPPPSKLNLLVYETKQTMAFVYGFMTSFVVCFLLILLSDPYGYFSSSSSSSPTWYFKDSSPNSSQNASPASCLPLNDTPLAVMQNQTVSFLKDEQTITNTSTNASTNSEGYEFFPNSSQSFPSHLQNMSSDGTQPIESSGMWDLSSVNSTAGAGVINQTSMGPIGGLRDEKNITSTASNMTRTSTSTYVTFSKLYEEYESMLGCDLYDGRWVKDESYPLYARGSCPYVDENFNCSNNGRPDSGYESYRWQPKQCNIPRLKGKDILELIRGKRLVIVGDSLNRNMWESLVCILKNSVEDQTRIVRNYGSHKFKDYDCSVEFFWAPFLVQQSEIRNTDGSKSKRLRLDVLDNNSVKYKDADILVFNSGAWYTDFKTSNGRNYYQQGSHVYPMLDQFRAYQRGMITWAKWVDANVNRTKTQLFFRGNSATHFGGGKWNSGGRCDWQTKPIREEKYLPDYPYKMKILESVMKYMKTHVHYLNITRLTAYRKDAHPAAYRRLYLTEKERMNPLRPQDCTHWCLPGVPDTWNEILYAQLLINHYKNWHKQKTTTT